MLNKRKGRILLRQTFLLALLSAVFGLTVFGQTQNLQPAQPALERDIAGKQTHLYRLKVKPGEFAQIRVEQKGVDVTVNLLAAAGEKLFERDSPNGTRGMEILSFVATAEDYQVEVKTLSETAPPGKYGIAVATHSQPDARDALQIEAEKNLIAAQQLRQPNTPEANLAAAPKYEAAVAGWQKLGDKYMESLTLGSLAFVIFKPEESGAKSLETINRAVALAKESGDKYLETGMIRNVGEIYQMLKQPDKALEFFARSIEMARTNGDAENEISGLESSVRVFFAKEDWKNAVAAGEKLLILHERAKNQIAQAYFLNLIGVAYDSLKERDRAAGYYKQSIALYRELKDALGEAAALENLGVTLDWLKKYDAALENYRASLTLWQTLKRTDKESEILELIVSIYGSRKKNAEKLAAYQELLTSYKKADQPAKITETLGSIGSVNYDLKKFAEAVAAYQEAAALWHKTGERAKEAGSLNSLGVTYGVMEQREQAIAAQTQALKIYRELGDKSNEALVLNNLGISTAALKKYDEAITLYRQALAIRRSLGETDQAVESLDNIVTVYQTQKDKPKAIAVTQEIIALYQATQNIAKEAYYLNVIGVFYSNLNDRKTALEFYQKALKAAREAKDKDREARVLYNIGAEYSVTGKYADAIETFTQSLQMRRDLHEKAEEGETLRRLAGNYESLGDYRKALEAGNQALAIFRELKNRSAEAESLIALASIYDSTNDHLRARPLNEEALKIAREEKNKNLEATALHNLSITLDDLGETAEALEDERQALALFRETDDQFGVVSALDGVSQIYIALGQYQPALKFLLETLPMRRKIGDRDGEGLNLARIGGVYLSLGDKDKALSYSLEAIPIQQETLSKANEIITTINVGSIYAGREDYPNADKYMERALALSREIGNLRKTSYALTGLALLAYLQENYVKADDYLQQALPLARISGSPESEASILGNLMTMNKWTGNKGLAIFYGKQAVNRKQEMRARLKGIEKDFQQSFLANNEDTYRKLADLLIDEGRLSEAQQVLAMLKEEETSEFVKRDAREIESLSKRADLRPDEKTALEKYNRLAGNLTALGAEFTVLDDKRKKLPEGAAFAEQSRYDQLSAQISDANTAFRIFLNKELVTELGKTGKTEIETDRALQGKLINWGAGTVALATVVGENRYRVILTTPKVQIDGKTEVSAAELNKKIFAFRAALRNPSSDPRAVGKELYDILIKPIEKDLQGAGAQTLLWSLDGTLRYIPVGALWDGQQYLAQRYQNVIVTSTTRQSLSASVEHDWRALGAGVTKQSQVTEGDGETISFDGLPSVAGELQTIVKNETGAPEEKGLLVGKRFLDAAFTVDALKNSLGKRDAANNLKYNVVHFATHFRLGSDTANSFLLLGGNQGLTLETVADSPEIDFTDVELVTLSACNTAFGNATNKGSGDGKEIESLAAFIENRGAKAVLATLWSVADESTQLLMAEFYRLHKENPKMTKAEAMQRAQIEMIEGTLKPTTTDSQKRAEAAGKRRGNDSLDDEASFRFDAAKPYAHPYFWSPFVLIGNWR